MPQGPAYNEADVSDKPDFVRGLAVMTPEEVDCARLQYQRRAEAMRAVDDMVGTVVAQLQASGELADTVLIFTSDNGYFLGEHRMFSKVLGYEEGVAAPLLLRGPGVPSGATRDKLVLSNDLAPTIAAWAGVTPGLQVDGRSLLPLIADPAVWPWRTRFLAEYLGNDDEYVVVPAQVLGRQDGRRPRRARRLLRRVGGREREPRVLPDGVRPGAGDEPPRGRGDAGGPRPDADVLDQPEDLRPVRQANLPGGRVGGPLLSRRILGAP